MMWGIIPFWHIGNYQKHGLTTNNCRLENMLNSKLYKPSFQKGQRCVILAEGFYEWQTTKDLKSSERDVYYFYMPQDSSKKDVKLETQNSTTTPVDCSKNMNLLKMAGLFDIWSDENGDNIYSYTVITFESVENFSWLHHRSPAILETEEQVAVSFTITFHWLFFIIFFFSQNWLDFKRVTDKEALATLKPAQSLVWHQVSKLVNNSRNKSDQCNKPIEQVQQKRKPNLMESWLVQKKPKLENEPKEN